MMRRLLFTGLLMWACIGPALGAPTPTRDRRGPDGFGKAKFGMTIDTVRRHYAALKPAPPGAGAPYFNSPNLARYMLTNVKVPGLTGRADLEFRFWKNQLWTIIVYYGGLPSSEVIEKLYRRYGPKTSGGTDATWVMSNSTIMTAPSEMWYSFADNTITKDVQQAFTAALAAEQARIGARTPAPPATPH